MDAEPQEQRVEGRTFHQPVDLPEPRTTPSHGLFQPYYALSEAKFLRLTRPASVVTSIGAGIAAFGISTGLPLLADAWLAQRSNTQANVDFSKVLVAVIASLLGLAIAGIGLLTSKDRRRVIKEIEQHFEENPGVAETRMRTR